MRKLAFYGKGGIGKSTVVSNLALLFARDGLRVLQFGCDPKADASDLMVDGEVTTVMEQWQQRGDGALKLEHCLMKGREGVDCIETGGPVPGAGCGGRGITKALELCGDLSALEPAYGAILFDVLGDVVCGGFAAPIRVGYADEVYIVTSGEARSLYAANNICWAVRQNARSGARLGGLIGNLRGVPDEQELLDGFAARVGTHVVACIPRDDAVALAERARMPVVAHAPESPAARAFADLNARLRDPAGLRLRVPSPLGRRDFEAGIGTLFSA
jgi:nitrogenase iron protein NifH